MIPCVISANVFDGAIVAASSLFTHVTLPEIVVTLACVTEKSIFAFAFLLLLPICTISSSVITPLITIEALFKLKSKPIRVLPVKGIGIPPVLRSTSSATSVAII